MVTKEWVAIHRKHHAKVETRRRSAQPADARHRDRAAGRAPSSIAPNRRTRKRWTSTATARRTTGSSATSTRASRWQGVGLMLAVNLMLFGPIGATIWAVQMMWIPITAAGIINGIGHYWGYRNFAVRRRVDEHRAVGHPDRRRGAAQQPPRLRHVGEAVVAVVRVRHRLDVHPHARRCSGSRRCARSRRSSSFDRVEGGARPRDAAGGHHPSLRGGDELRPLAQGRLRGRDRRAARARARATTARRAEPAPDQALAARRPGDADRGRARAARRRRSRTARCCDQIYAMRQELAALWERSTESSEQLLARLQDWCHRAEASGIAPLAQFSLKLRRYA